MSRRQPPQQDAARRPGDPSGADGPAPVTRRALLTAPALLASGSLLASGCAREDPEPPGPEPVEEVGVPVPAPSGEVTAVLDTAGDTLGVLLRDGEGTDFWADDYSYSPDQPPGLVWQTDAESDVLWVLPDDGSGAARISQDSEGTWSKQPAADLDEEIPEDIAYWL